MAAPTLAESRSRSVATGELKVPGTPGVNGRRAHVVVAGGGRLARAHGGGAHAESAKRAPLTDVDCSHGAA